MRAALAFTAWLLTTSVALALCFAWLDQPFIEDDMKHQLPGRQEALRAVLTGDKSPELRHMAGMAKATQRQPPAKALETFTFSSGIEQLTPEQRVTLPF